MRDRNQSDAVQQLTDAKSLGDSGLGRDTGPDIFISGAVLNSLRRVAKGSSRRIEGFLGGQLVFSKSRPALMVEALFFYPLCPTPHSINKEHFEAAQDLFAQEFPDLKILGWFAVNQAGSAPSDHDRLLTHTFFGEPWQVALVLEAERDDCGIYSWQDSEFAVSTRVQVLDAKEEAPSAGRARRTRPQARLQLAGTIGFLVMVAVLALAVTLLWPRQVIPVVDVVETEAGGPDLVEQAPTEPEPNDPGGSGSPSGGLAGSAVPLPNAGGGTKTNTNTNATGSTDTNTDIDISTRPLPAADRTSGVADTSSGDRPQNEGFRLVQVTPPPGTERSEPGDRRYTVKEGESLWRIAETLVGDPTRYKEIWEVNPSISNPDFLPSGTTLVIPDSMADATLNSRGQ